MAGEASPQGRCWGLPPDPGDRRKSELRTARANSAPRPPFLHFRAHTPPLSLHEGVTRSVNGGYRGEAPSYILAAKPRRGLGLEPPPPPPPPSHETWTTLGWREVWEV